MKILINRIHQAKKASLESKRLATKVGTTEELSVMSNKTLGDLNILSDNEIKELLCMVCCIRRMNRRIYVYGDEKNLLCTYSGPISEIRIFIESRGWGDYFYFHRSYILNLNVFDQEEFSVLNNKRIAKILEEWGVKLTTDLMPDLREKIKKLRKKSLNRC